MFRKVDELGRIVIPIEIRKQLKINEGDTLNIVVENQKIILEKSFDLDINVLKKYKKEIEKKIKELERK